jgi:hypothetical protein
MKETFGYFNRPIIIATLVMINMLLMKEKWGESTVTRSRTDT